MPARNIPAPQPSMLEDQNRVLILRGDRHRHDYRRGFPQVYAGSCLLLSFQQRMRKGFQFPIEVPLWPGCTKRFKRLINPSSGKGKRMFPGPAGLEFLKQWWDGSRSLCGIE